MAGTLDPLKLPDGLQSTGDPVDGNPFPETHPKHQVWSDATRGAEEEHSRLNSHISRERPAPEHAVYADWEIRLYVGRFEIWAKRAVHVVWSDADARHYDQWLFNHAEATLGTARQTAPFFVDVETLLCELRLRLLERVEYWKAEARRYVAEQKAHTEAVDAGWPWLESKRLQGADLADCLREAYDHHASLLTKGGRPLTEIVLNQQIPALVFEGALHYRWIHYPLMRRVGSEVVGDVAQGQHDSSDTTYESVPEQELTDTYRGRKVTKGYEQQFKIILVNRIAHCPPCQHR